jgi:hypothetical protein
MAADELATIVDQLEVHRCVQSLAWWRIQDCRLARTAVGRRLRQTFVQDAISSRAGEAEVCQVFRLAGAHGFDALLVKGWSVARHYADSALRPYGDIDLCVPPNQLERAKQALAGVPADVELDVHIGVPDLPDRTWEQVFARSVVVPLDDVPIRVLGPEDLLRLVCLHLARHGGWRPLWLCDVAALLEAAPADFDWNYCLSGRPALSRWVLAVTGLAHRVLEARISDPTIQEWALEALPSWMEEAVRWRWATGRHRRPFSFYCRHPRAAVDELFYHGLSPIRSAFRLGPPPRTKLALVGVQLAAFACLRLPGQLARQFKRRTTPSTALTIHEDIGY